MCHVKVFRPIAYGSSKIPIHPCAKDIETYLRQPISDIVSDFSQKKQNALILPSLKLAELLLSSIRSTIGGDGRDVNSESGWAMR